MYNDLLDLIKVPALVILGIGAFCYGIRILVGWAVIGRLRDEYRKAFAEYDKRLKDLTARQESLDLAYTADKQSQSDPVRNLVRRELIGVHRGTEAASNHLNACQLLARAASWSNHTPIEEAQRLLDHETLFTGDFPGAWQSAEVRPAKLPLSNFLHLLEQRFTDAAKRLERLEAPAEFLFPSRLIEALLARADDLGIPRTSLADHPLFLAGRVDSAAYEKLNALRLAEPETYLNLLDAQTKKEHDVAQRFAQLETAITELNDLHQRFMKTYPEPLLAAALSIHTSHLGNPFTEEMAYRKKLYECRAAEEIEHIAASMRSFYQETELGMKLPATLLVAELEARQEKSGKTVDRVNHFMQKKNGRWKSFEEHGYLCKKAGLIRRNASDCIGRTKQHLENNEYPAVFREGLEARLLCDQTDQALAEAEQSLKNPPEKTGSFE